MLYCTFSSRVAWIAISCALLCLPLAREAHAVVVYLRGQSQPLYGALVREDSSSVVLLVENEQGKTVERVIARSETDAIRNPINAARLEKLAPTSPADYFEYAEELAAASRDPDARQTARRLYHLAATLAPDTLTMPSLRGLHYLATSPQEKRRLDAAIYLLSRDPSIELMAEDGAAASVIDIAKLKQLQTLVAGIRRREAATLAQIEREPMLLGELSAMFPKLAGKFGDAASGPWSDELLALLLEVEISLGKQLLERALPTAERTTSPAAQSWSTGYDENKRAVPPLPTMERLTEFDPSHTVYRNGKWQPGAAP